MANKQNKKPASAPAPQNKPATPLKSTTQTKVSGQKAAELKKDYSLTIKLALILGILSLVVYANTIRNGFVLDDSSAVLENTIVSKGASAIPEILSTPYRRGFFITSNDLYRPLSLVTFSIEYSMFEKNPMPYHVVNILVFAGCVMLLFLFLDKLFERKRTAVAFITTLLFALHPIHTEVVANIKSRDELLCFFFVFLSLNIFIKYIQTGKMKNLLLGVACFFLSLLSKETVITFLAIIPLIFFFYRNEEKKRSVYITVGIAIAAVVFLMIRVSVLSAYNANGIADIDYADNGLAMKTLAFSSRIATAVLIMGYYLKLLFIPYPLVCDYAFNTIPFTTFADPRVLLTLAIYIFLGVFGIRLFLKNKKDPYAFAILFYLISMSLFSNIIFLIGSEMGERFLFFGSIGFCMVVALLLDKLVNKTANTDVISTLKKPLVMGVLVPVSLVFSILTINRNADWLSNYTLYGADIKKSTNSGKLNYFYGLELQKTVATEEKDPEKQKQIRLVGISYLQKALSIDPDFGNAQSDLGNAYFCLGQYDSAEYHERRAIEINPTNNIAANNLAGVYYFAKKYRESIDLSKKAIEAKPEYVNAYSNLGRCYLAIGRVDSAIHYLYMGINVDPSYSFDYEIMAYAYKAIGIADSVRKYVAITQKVKPGFNL
jgi:protein O-mannosyl-transferase